MIPAYPVVTPIQAAALAGAAAETLMLAEELDCRSARA